MVNSKYFVFRFVTFLIMGSYALSQFIEVQIELDMRRLSEGDRQLFDTLAEDIENYFLNTQFSTEIENLNMVIDMRLILESVSQAGSQTTINAQALLSNKMDQYFYAKGIQFPYSKGRKMYYTTSFDPLSSFLDYYAFMFIATELDTWKYMGGTSFFNLASDLTNLGKDSDWSRGWDESA